jgi:hypothetical protein
MKTALLPVVFALSLAFLAQPLSAQNKAEENPNLYTGVSAVILPKDKTEFNLINSLSSFWVAVNGYDGALEATRITNRYRYGRSDHLLRISHGFSRSGRWDLGADLYYTRTRLDDAARSSAFRVLGNRETPEGSTYSGISAVGFQFRCMPFLDMPELTLRAGLSQPIARSEEQRLRLNAQRTQLFVSGVYSTRMAPGLLAFLQGDLRAFLRTPENERALLSPGASGYLVFETPNQRWYFYPGLSYSLTFQQGAKGAAYRKSSSILFGNAGLLFRPGLAWSFLLSGQVPFIFESGSSRSLWVRESYLGFNLGLRYIL